MKLKPKIDPDAPDDDYDDPDRIMRSMDKRTRMPRAQTSGIGVTREEWDEMKMKMSQVISASGNVHFGLITLKNDISGLKMNGKKHLIVLIDQLLEALEGH